MANMIVYSAPITLRVPITVAPPKTTVERPTAVHLRHAEAQIDIHADSHTARGISESLNLIQIQRLFEKLLRIYT